MRFRRRDRMLLTLTVGIVTLLFVTVSSGSADVRRTEEGYEFTYEDPSAASVSLAGGFNNWNAGANPMVRDQEGVWRVTIQLAPGKHEYKFVVNGSNWIADPDNPIVVGDYGNSQIEIGSDGEFVAVRAPARFANTTLSSRVALNGYFRATYQSESEVGGDTRLRLRRPDHEFNLDINVKASDNVTGSGRLRFDTSLGDVQETQGRLYSAHLDLLAAGFDLRAYYNEEELSFDDPLEILGHEDLVGTIREEHIAYGRGSQGALVTGNAVGGEGLLFYSNIYDFELFNNPAIFDNTDTDVMGARVTKGFEDGAVRAGLSWLRKQNGWWVDFTSAANTSAVIDSFKARTGSPSDWFEVGTAEQMLAADVRFALPYEQSLSLEYGYWTWDAAWDVGNRERYEGTNLVNGAIDVPLGKDSGHLFKAVLEGSGSQSLWWEISHEVQRYKGMDAGELYVDFCQPPFADHSINTFTGINAISELSIEEFPPLPERKTDLTEIDLTFRWGIASGIIEVDRTKMTRLYSVPTDVAPDVPSSQTNEQWRIAPGISITPLGGRLLLALDYEWIGNKPDGDFFVSGSLTDQCAARYYDTRELIVSGSLGFTERLAALWDVRRMVYAANERQVPSPKSSYVSPYAALSYTPSPNIEVRLGYHVNPTYYIDTPAEGRGNGRQRWRDRYMWDHGATIFDAEEALSDVRMISLMGVIKF